MQAMRGYKPLQMEPTLLVHSMILEYIAAALEHARYKLLDDAEYGKVPELPGVPPTGRTLDECRRNLPAPSMNA